MKFLIYFFQFIFLLLLAIIQVSIITPFFPQEFSINIIYTLLLLLIFFNKKELLLPWMIAGGLLLDIFSTLPFGTLTLIIVINVTLIYLTFNYLLTNRSDSSLILIFALGYLLFNTSIYFILYIHNIIINEAFLPPIMSVLSITLTQVITMTILSLVAYITVRIFGKRK